jgi:hypothetical protein
MIPDDDEIADDDLPEDTEPSGFELDAVLIARADAEREAIEAERREEFMAVVYAWASTCGGIELHERMTDEQIDVYLRQAYRAAHPPAPIPESRFRVPLKPTPQPPAPPQAATVRSAHGVRTLGLPKRPAPPALKVRPSSEPGYREPIARPGGFPARKPRSPPSAETLRYRKFLEDCDDDSRPVRSR